MKLHKFILIFLFFTLSLILSCDDDYGTTYRIIVVCFNEDVDVTYKINNDSSISPPTETKNGDGIAIFSKKLEDVRDIYVEASATGGSTNATFLEILIYKNDKKVCSVRVMNSSTTPVNLSTSIDYPDNASQCN